MIPDNAGCAIGKKTTRASLAVLSMPNTARRCDGRGWPDAIQDRQDDRRLLERRFGLYEPLKRSFHQFGDSEHLGLAPSARNHAGRFSRDWAALGTDVRRSRVVFAP
jgi:hypothetical protein